MTPRDVGKRLFPNAPQAVSFPHFDPLRHYLALGISPGGASVNSQGCKPLGRRRPRRPYLAPEGRRLIARGVNPWNETVFSPGGAAVNSQGCKPLEAEIGGIPMKPWKGDGLLPPLRG